MALRPSRSALDASFLHLERLETPMHVGAVSIFEGAPYFDDSGRFRLAELRRLVGSRLHLIPRFRKRIMHVPFEQGRPVWVDDARFDIAYHVRLTALPDAGEPGAAPGPHGADPGAAARPDATAVGAVVRRGARRRQRRADPEDAPRAGRRRLRRRRRDRPARLHPGPHVPRAAAGSSSRRRARAACSSTRCTSARPSPPRSRARRVASSAHRNGPSNGRANL